MTRVTNSHLRVLSLHTRRPWCKLYMLLTIATPLLFWQCRCWDEEVDMPTFELQFWCDYHNLPRHSLRTWLSQDMVGVRCQDFCRGDGAAVLLHMAAEMHDADNIEDTTRTHASQAAPEEAVAHFCLLLCEGRLVIYKKGGSMCTCRINGSPQVRSWQNKESPLDMMIMQCLRTPANSLCELNCDE